jgi:PHD/YefM family antitoxin component YafN of YafNO toxin-antitoxin module
MTRKRKQKPMVRHLPITKARINLGAVVKQVHLNKEYVVLEKDGIPIVALMDAEEFEDYLELQDPEVKRHIAASTKEYREGKSFPAEDLIAELEEKEGAKRGRRR